MSLGRELNATMAICGRDIVRFFRDRNNIGMSILFPVIFLAIFGSTIGQNLGGGLPYNYMQFVLLGMVASLALMFTANLVTNLVEERETGFTQGDLRITSIEIFDPHREDPGASVNSLVIVAATIAIGVAIGIQISLVGIGLILLIIPFVLLLGGAFGVLVSGIFNSSPRMAGRSGHADNVPPDVPFWCAHSDRELDRMAQCAGPSDARNLPRGPYERCLYWGTPTYSLVVLYNPLIDLTVTVTVSNHSVHRRNIPLRSKRA